MCVSRELPTVISFLMLYSLRCGCLTIFLWTTFRTLLCLFFFMVSIAEVFLQRASPFGVKLFARTDEAPGDDLLLSFIFYSYIFMIVTEWVMLIHVLCLGVGIYNGTSQPIGIYLICRFFTLLSEFVILVALCLSHQLLIGWYLGFLMFVVLEFYALVVVYSFFVYTKEEEDKDKCNKFQA